MLKMLHSPPLEGSVRDLKLYSSEDQKNLEVHLGTSEAYEVEKADLLAFEEEVYKNHDNDEYLLDLQIEQSREEAEGGRITAY